MRIGLRTSQIHALRGIFGYANSVDAFRRASGHPATPTRESRAIPPRASELIGEFGDDFVEVADEADVGDLEDGGVLILVDGDDGLRILHAGEVLAHARVAVRALDFGGSEELR